MPTSEEWAEYTERYVSQRRANGEKRVAVWVPEHRVEELKAVAAKMRAEELLAQEKPSPTPRLVIPKVDIPRVPPPGWAHLRIEREERALHKMLKANGGDWSTRDKAWVIRSDLVDSLGIRNRVIRIVRTKNSK